MIDAAATPGANVVDRSYFETVVDTQKPFVSEGLTTRHSGEHAIVMAVPTRDAAGKLSGVLAGVVLVSPASTGSNGIDLGFAGLVVGSVPDVDGYVTDHLGPLLDYDTKRGSELVKTLQAYFDAGGSPRHAATQHAASSGGCESRAPRSTPRRATRRSS